MAALLREKKCLPCRGGVPPLESQECQKLCNQLNSRWHLNDRSDRLFCSLEVSDPRKNILYLFRKLGELSEHENHHPELRWFRGRLDIEIWTHKISALVESDFILAAKMDIILAESGIETQSFDKACCEGALPTSTETYRGWSICPRNNIHYRSFSFPDFKLPWEYTLTLLDPTKDFYGENLGMGLGFGHLEVRMDGLQERTIMDKINQLIKV